MAIAWRPFSRCLACIGHATLRAERRSASCLVVTEVHRNRSWPSWARGTLVALASAMMTKSAPVTDDLPCDLLEFLAQRCGIEVERAAELVGDFLMQYEPASVALPSFASWRAA